MPTKEKVANLTASAVVDVTLRIQLDSRWGADCPAEQIFRQARREAINMLNNALYAERESMRHKIVIVDTPMIKTVIGVRS